jgi:hypothetical protein
MRDPVFRRIAVCLGASQCAAVALQTLWIAPWLRDVAGYTSAEVARGLLAVNVAMVIGYLGFARAAEAFARRGRSALPLLAGGVVAASLSLAGLILLSAVGLAPGAVGLAPVARGLAMALWCVFVGTGTAVVLGYSIVSPRYAKSMAGRVNTGINLLGFIGMFSGQWVFGLVLDLWPQSPAGYAPEAYPWALGFLWIVQFAGLAWLWRGRKLLG